MTDVAIDEQRRIEQVLDVQSGLAERSQDVFEPEQPIRGHRHRHQGGVKKPCVLAIAFRHPAGPQPDTGTPVCRLDDPLGWLAECHINHEVNQFLLGAHVPIGSHRARPEPFTELAQGKPPQTVLIRDLDSRLDDATDAEPIRGRG